MKTYELYVEETLSKVVTVEAEDELDAREKAWEMYKNEEIVLDASNIQSTEIDLV